MRRNFPGLPDHNGAGLLPLFIFPQSQPHDLFLGLRDWRNRALARSAGDRPGHSAAFTCDKTLRDCKRSVLLQAGLTVPIGACLYLTDFSFAFYHQNPSHLHGLTSVDAILPFFAVHELHFGIAGFIVAAILASSMAVMSAGINSLTTATTVDFYQRIFRPNETPEHYANVGRVGNVVWGLVVTFLALFAVYSDVVI